MGRIWLTVCRREDAAAIRNELVGRDPAPRILRVGDPERLVPVALRFEGEEIAVAVGLRGIALGVAERVIGDVAREAGCRDILVFADVDDPGVIARCFYAGATEVITAEDACERFGAGALCEARAEERHVARREGSASVDDELPPWCERDDAGLEEPDAGDGSPAEPLRADTCPPAGGCDGATADTDGASGREEAVRPADASVEGPRAPLIAVIAGRGGCGRTTLVASMAACAARAGLRAAVLDLDLMFGTLPLVFGADSYTGCEGLAAHAGDTGLAEQDIEATAMRIGPGLTLWGPCAVPEHAELVSRPIEQLIQVLRGMSDIILADTSTFWGDAVAMAVSSCDRCLVVGSSGSAQVPSAKRAIELAERIGVPRTRMTCVFNRVGARGCGEEQALHFEMGVSLRSRARIAYGGDEVASMASFGRFDGLMAGSGPFAQSVRAFTGRLLQELGCPIDTWLLDEEQRRASSEERPRIRLPWSARAGADE